MIRIRTITMCAAAVVATGCAVTPPEEDPLYLKMQEIERRLAAVERVLANGSLVDLTLQLDTLQREVAALRGRTDTIEHNAEGTASRQRDLYVDLDERVQALEEQSQAASGQPSVLDGGSLAPGELPVPGGSDSVNYRAAFELLKEQRYDEAGMAFQQFLQSFPDSQRANNAQYWLAESFYVTDQFERALQEFELVITRYPDSPKVPDALLKMGYCNYALERWNDARGALARVQTEYAETTAARLAEQRLARMTEEGH